MTKKAAFLEAARLLDQDLGRLMIVEPRSEDRIETVPDHTMIVEVEGARDGDFRAGRSTSLSARFFAARKSRLSIMADVSA
jgi:hypothetical protein